MKTCVALFGQAEKGVYDKPYFLQSLPQLIDILGQAPEESLGLGFAVQALMYERALIFFRVKEEGFSVEDYFLGFKRLAQKENMGTIDALCLPGVGDDQIIEKAEPLCHLHKSVIILTEKDFYDFLTTT